MKNNYLKYRRIFLEPSINDIRLKNNLISLEDFEYYENESYNPIFMRALGNSIYAINAIYMDFQNDTEKLQSIFNYMPFGFGKLVKDDSTENIALYTTSNEEHFYKSLNDEDFLGDLEGPLKGKRQMDFSFRKEGNNLDETYSGIIYEENAIFNLKTIIKNDFEELPNLIFYIKSQKIETINKISKIFNFKLVNDEITNATVEIQPKIPFWGGIINIPRENRIIDIKKYYGYNEMDFVFLNKKEKIIESNKIYYNILERNTNIIFKNNYAYFVEIKLSFPSDPEKVIMNLFQKAKNLFSLYKEKYNLEHLGIVLVYDSVESNGNSFCNNVNINFSNENIDFHIIYLHVTVQVSNMNYLIKKVSKIENKLDKTETELGETRSKLEKTETELNKVGNFQKLLFSKLLEIFPDKKEILLSVEEELKNMQDQEKKEDIEKINSNSPKTIENKNDIIISSNAQTPIKNEDNNSNKINVENNENNMKNNIENQNYLDIDKNGRENVKDKFIQNSSNDNSINLINDNKIDIINDTHNNIEDAPEKINFNVIAGRFKKIDMDYTEHKFKNIVIKEKIKNSLNIFKELNEEIIKFNQLSNKAYLKQDTILKELLFKSLFTGETRYLEKINTILEDIIKTNKGAISKEFMILKNLFFGYNNNYSPLFSNGKGAVKSFTKQYIYSTVYLLEKDSPENLDIYYSSLLKIIMELISRTENNKIEFYRLVKFCLLVYKDTNYSIEHFISNFIEGMNTDNEAFLVERQNPKLKTYIRFIKSKVK